ncbi:menaquinone-dependent protoporphyrinogen IX dehydrogenase [Apibacter sp. HY039]|uniref:menaquinone-dependent protoporphyrinogen IX dehydrogenase n=1 Tax=Apibacter sp. HY039 TaxID=2501476 RepID=UPI000FEC00B3|nr:menaquinone-dependent protoporphyrinogen IX dehydrogenase [Apibacter sp. HY039]
MGANEKKVLIVYSSTDGQSRKISNFIAQNLTVSADIFSIETEIPEIGCYDGIIIGASIRYGVHRKKIIDFINLNYPKISMKCNAFFSVSLVSRKTEKRTVSTNPYIQKFLRRILWKPDQIALFAGMLDYPSYGLLDRILIQLIMRITKGPTDSKTKIEYTDWSQVKQFTSDFNSRLR